MILYRARECRHEYREQALTVLLHCLVLLALSTSSGVAAKEPWDAPPFSVDPDVLLKAAAEVPSEGSDGAVILLLEVEYVFDAEGRRERRRHLIYTPVASAAVLPWSNIEVPWSPWYQERPEVRARVITPDGEVHDLDTKNLGEYSASESGPNEYGDRMALSGPLPAMTVGAVVEEQHIVRDREPLFAAGLVERFAFAWNVPIHRTRLILDAPSTLPLQHVQRLLPDLETREEKRKGRVRLTFEHGPRKAWESDWPLAPADVPRVPHVAFSTGSSWADVAKLYAELVGQKLQRAGVSKLAKKAKGNAQNRHETIANVLAFTHERVRYTGLEFGVQSIVPVAPQETLKRHFGDCKDKATLLIALLREVGIEAHVALLMAGPGADVDRDLPGLGLFNHAIVYIGGPELLWIDATAQYSPLGQLPVPVQGRLALVARPDTTELIRTPVSRAADNRTMETREIYLATSGGARVVETTDWYGHFSEVNRQIFSLGGEKARREQLESYGESTYGAEKLTSLELSDLDDLSGPLRLRLEMEEAAFIGTAAPDAVVGIPLGVMIRELPEVLLPSETEDAEEEEPAGDAGGDALLGPQDVILPVPHVLEMRYEVHPPPGYAMRDVPQDGTWQFGAATLTKQYRVADDGVVTAMFRFDSGTRYSPDEVAALTSSLEEFYEEDAPFLHFEQLGEVYLSEGRIAEALQEFRKLVEQFPDDPSARSQIALALLAAGFGEEARKEARRAVEFDEGSAPAWRTLGVILAHDRLGRKFRRGFDREGAVEALRKAKELDSQDFEARGELAILLEHSTDGLRYTDEAKMTEATEEYRAIRKDLEVNLLDENLMMVLLYLGRFEELGEVARESEDQGNSNTLIIVSLAATKGPDSAIREASRLTSGGQPYRQLLLEAAQLLVLAREYEKAAALLVAGSKGDPQALTYLGQAEMLRKTKRHLDDVMADKTPEDVLRSIVAASFTSRDPAETVHALLAKSVLEAGKLSADDPPSQALEQAMHRMRMQLQSQMGAIAFIQDVFLSHATFATEGDDEKGYRVRVKFGVFPGAQEVDLAAYVVAEDVGYRIVSFNRPPAPAGLQILSMVDEGRLDAARQWLDWMLEELPDRRRDDPLQEHPLRRFWSKGKVDSSPDALRHAAAVILSGDQIAERAVPILQSGREAASRDRRIDFDLALVRMATVLGKWEIAEESARSVLESFPDSELAISALGMILTKLGRREEVERIISDRLENAPEDLVGLRLAAGQAQERRNAEEWRRWTQAALDTGEAGPLEYNNLAWADIVLDRVSEDTLQTSQRAVISSRQQNTAALHTLATVYAVLGRPAEARDVLLKVVDSRFSDTLESIDWYVLGHIAEAYGLVRIAADAYGKVEPDEDGNDNILSTYGLAQRRLAALRRQEASGAR